MSDGAQKEMNQSHFNNVIRSIKNGSIDHTKYLRHATHINLRRLRVRRNVSKAVSGIPKGSDQASPMSVVRWMEKITRKDAKAIEQLVAIDATAVVRMQ
jgi:hypothetical protein